MFPKKFIEWREIDGTTWHLFIGNKSICSRAVSNGKFHFAQTKPPENAKLCKFCTKNMIILRDRVDQLTK